MTLNPCWNIVTARSYTRGVTTVCRASSESLTASLTGSLLRVSVSSQTEWVITVLTLSELPNTGNRLFQLPIGGSKTSKRAEGTLGGPKHSFLRDLPTWVLSKACLCLFFLPREPGGTEVIKTTGSSSGKCDMKVTIGGLERKASKQTNRQRMRLRFANCHTLVTEDARVLTRLMRLINQPLADQPCPFQW